jgi:hypothetical protein
MPHFVKGTLRNFKTSFLESPHEKRNHEGTGNTCLRFPKVPILKRALNCEVIS